MKICPNCNHENNDSSKFCVECGAKLNGTPKFCPNCGHKIVCDENEDSDSNNYFEDIVISTEFKTYNAHVKWPYDYEMTLGDTLRFGNYNKAQNLISSNKDIDYFIDHLSDVHDAKMLKLLWENGLLRCRSENVEILSSMIYRYSNVLTCFREDPTHDFSETGDIFRSEDDIHNKFLGIIQFLLEKEFSVNEVLGLTKSETPLLIAIDQGLVKLTFYLIKEWNADVNFIPESVNGNMNNAPLEKLLSKIADYDTSIELEEDKTVLLNENYAIAELLLKHNAKITEKDIIIVKKINNQEIKNRLYSLLNITEN